ncbi:hypothetical protein SCUCBS95973_008315 [Sporothrix curviconia]|uniref:Uncharacterized protein n=1 Tax=Sporothrix curviconia TaxID=1260050 RepID=A0ABP0CMI8_9PEZI
MKSKHHSYYELVENKDKKKKLEFQITNKKTPPPGFEFVPISKSELTAACKELSREQDAMIFIVSNSSLANSLIQQETSYANARRAVEQLCLDVLVKWRGDEENGRDQLDEILREVIVISDSEGEDDDGEDEEADSSGVESGDLAAEPSYLTYPATRTTHYDENVPVLGQPHRPYMQDEYVAHQTIHWMCSLWALPHWANTKPDGAMSHYTLSNGHQAIYSHRKGFY